MLEGKVLNGRFRLIKELGAGSMGSVWQALDLTLDAPAAVKLIEPSFISSAESLLRFRREAKATASIRSTNVVQILDYGVADGMPYIAMELLKGESLGARLDREGALDPELAITLLSQVARAIGLAHEQGIIHRDLKPDNIFLVRELGEDIAKVVDFGIARKVGGLEDTGGLRTQTGAIMGTPYYMSPEQLAAELVDERTDVWAFGVIAFECLTGGRPFVHDTFGGLMVAVREHDLPVPSQRNRVPVGFDSWFSRTCNRNKGERTPTITDAANGLRALLNRPLVTSPRQPVTMASTSGANAVSTSMTRTLPRSAGRKTRTWILLGLGGLGALLLGLFARSFIPGESARATASVETIVNVPPTPIPTPERSATSPTVETVAAPALPSAELALPSAATRATKPIINQPVKPKPASVSPEPRTSAKSTVAAKPAQTKSNDIAGF